MPRYGASTTCITRACGALIPDLAPGCGKGVTEAPSQATPSTPARDALSTGTPACGEPTDDRGESERRCTPVAQALRAQLFVLSPGAEVALRSMAKRMGMSARTLQRRLAEEGTSHQRIVEQTREEASKRMLARTNLGVAEVAFALGFSEPAAFHRAFKRWTGLTPAGYRQSLRPSGDAAAGRGDETSRAPTKTHTR